MKSRERLDDRLVREGLIETPALARSLVIQGKVRVDGVVVTKPGTQLKGDVELEVDGAQAPVGRGYHKLEAGLQRLGLSVTGKVCLDAGASTGGFTELLLERGAARVYAVDVGYGQLAWKLRQDPRVEVHERTNVRLVAPHLFDPTPEVLVADLSFISLTKVLPHVGTLLVPGAAALVLLKPQFEAGPGRIEKGGLVRRPDVHRAIVGEVLAAVVAAGWAPVGLCPSPIRGAKGNLEFLLKLRSPGSDLTPGVSDADVVAAVAEGHRG